MLLSCNSSVRCKHKTADFLQTPPTFVPAPASKEISLIGMAGPTARLARAPNVSGINPASACPGIAGEPRGRSFPADVRWCSPLRYRGLVQTDAGGGWTGAEREPRGTARQMPLLDVIRHFADCANWFTILLFGCEWDLALLSWSNHSSSPIKFWVFFF